MRCVKVRCIHIMRLVYGWHVVLALVDCLLLSKVSRSLRVLIEDLEASLLPIEQLPPILSVLSRPLRPSSPLQINLAFRYLAHFAPHQLPQQLR